MTRPAHLRQLPAVLLMILATTLAAEGGVASIAPRFFGTLVYTRVAGVRVVFG